MRRPVRAASIDKHGGLEHLLGGQAEELFEQGDFSRRWVPESAAEVADLRWRDSELRGDLPSRQIEVGNEFGEPLPPSRESQGRSPLDRDAERLPIRGCFGARCDFCTGLNLVPFLTGPLAGRRTWRLFQNQQ